IVLMSVGHRVGHQRCRVDRGDEENRHEDDRDDGDDSCGREVFQECEQSTRYVFLFDDGFYQATFTVEFDIESRVAKDPKPDDRETGWDCQDPGDELPNRAAFRDSCDEDADVWRP